MKPAIASMPVWNGCSIGCTRRISAMKTSRICAARAPDRRARFCAMIFCAGCALTAALMRHHLARHPRRAAWCIANTPLTVVEGPMAQAQLLETALLNHLNYQTLVATKAARIRESSQGRLVLEFGLRRGQDRAANAGTRAALIGGADFCVKRRHVACAGLSAARHACAQHGAGVYGAGRGRARRLSRVRRCLSRRLPAVGRHGQCVRKRPAQCDHSI